jgi:major membrane immunogen (membrane-anchored lipoprotein)
MKLAFTAPLLAVALITGCATSSSVPMGMKAGQFVTFNCEGGKTFMARAAADGSTVRVRYEGGYELDNKGAGVYEAEGWKLVTQGPGAAELMHNGKSVRKNCKAA